VVDKEKFNFPSRVHLAANPFNLFLKFLRESVPCPLITGTGNTTAAGFAGNNRLTGINTVYQPVNRLVTA